MIKGNFNETDCSLIIKSEGLIGYKEIIQSFKSLRNDVQNIEYLRVIEFAENSEYNLNYDDLNKITKVVSKIVKSFSSVQYAIIQNKALNTAFSMILANRISTSNCSVRVFCTENAAKDWLGMCGNLN